MCLSDSRQVFLRTSALCGDLIKRPVPFSGCGQACASDRGQSQGEACAALPTLCGVRGPRGAVQGTRLVSTCFAALLPVCLPERQHSRAGEARGNVRGPLSPGSCNRTHRRPCGGLSVGETVLGEAGPQGPGAKS